MRKNFDVSKSALLVMHVQNDIVDPKGLFAYSGAYKQVEKHNLKEKLRKLIKACREADLRVIYINVGLKEGYPELAEESFPIMQGGKEAGAFLENTWGYEVPEEVKPEPGDLVINNYSTSAFSHTNLDQILRAQGIKELLLTGVVTNFIVDCTARYGAELGYDITIVEDGCVSFTEEMHKATIEYNMPQYGIIVSTDEVINALNK